VRYHLWQDSTVASNGESKLSSYTTVITSYNCIADSIDFSFSFPDADRRACREWDSTGIYHLAAQYDDNGRFHRSDQLQCVEMDDIMDVS